jgi:hypothetical protein
MTIKAEELRKLTDVELKTSRTKKELFNERSNIYTRGASKNTKACPDRWYLRDIFQTFWDPLEEWRIQRWIQQLCPDRICDSKLGSSR